MQNSDGSLLPVGPSSGHEYYGIAVKVDRKWQAPETNEGGYSWGTIFQLHGPDELHVSPSVALMAEADFHIDICGGDVTAELRRALILDAQRCLGCFEFGGSTER
jgi:hypothetical protein